MINKVILTADDYGVCDRIDNAIDESIKDGKLTSVAFMVTHDEYRDEAGKIQNAGGWQKRLDRLIELKKKYNFGIGLHFSITSGSPRTKDMNSSFRHPVDKDKFRVIKNYNFKQVSASEVAKELEEQIVQLKSILDKHQIEIDHLSNHHNVVYFDSDLFHEYARLARKYSIPMRSPMPWRRKFDGVSELPDFIGGELLNPTILRGVVIGMWRRLSQASYGNILKLMNSAERLGVSYPDVLCEYMYGQCKSGKNYGEEVIAHVFKQFEVTKKSEKVDYNGISMANQKTIEKGKKGKNPELEFLVKRYEMKQELKEFSAELILHLGRVVDGNQGYDKENPPHGINTDYFDERDEEWKALDSSNLKDLAAERNVELITYRRL